MAKTVVYVIGPSGGPLKIGIADDATTRRSILNVGNPLYLRVHHAQKVEDESAAKSLERQLHYQFQNSHIRGEWFQLNESDLPTIRQVILSSQFFEYNLEGWSLERKSCDEFTPTVCARARRALDLTESALAEKAQLTEHTVKEFEAGRSAPHSATVESLQNALEDLGIEFVREQPGKPLKILI